MKRIFVLYGAVALALLLTSCVNTNNANPKADAYTFTKIKDGISGLSSIFISDSNVVYLLEAVRNGDGSYTEPRMFELDTTDYSLAPREYHMYVDINQEFCNMHLMPDGRMWLYLCNSETNSYMLKLISSHSEVEAEIEVSDYFDAYIGTYSFAGMCDSYLYKIIGCTIQSELVVWTPKRVFAIADNGQVTTRWDLDDSGNERHAKEIALSGSEIYYMDSPVFDEDGDGASIFRLCPDGSIELVYQLSTKHTNLFVDEHKVFYVYNYNDSLKRLYRLAENGELDVLFSIDDLVAPGSHIHDFLALPNDEFLMRIFDEIYIVNDS